MSSNQPLSRDPLRSALRQCRRAAALVVAFGAVTNLLFLATPIYLIQVFDRALASRRVETLLMLTLICIFALLVMGVLEAVRQRLLVRTSAWLDESLSPALLVGTLRAGLTASSATAQPLRDLGAVRGFIAGGLKNFLDLPWMPLFLGALWLLHPMLGAFALGAGLLLFALALAAHAVTARATREAAAARIVNEALADQAIRSAETLKAMGMGPRLIAHWRERNQRMLSAERAAGQRAAALMGASRFTRLAAQTGILGLGAYFVLGGDLSAGGIIAGSILMGRALAPLEQAVGAWKGMIAARAALARLRAAAPQADGTPMPLPRPAGYLSVQDVWYAPVLKGVSFALAPGEALALVGPSASGKSTLCKLLVGAWQPTKGHVRLDGADVFDGWPAEQLGEHVGYVPQDVEFVPATVQETIARHMPDADPDAVAAAALAAGAHEMILALPQGYATPIGAGGHRLSGGQRQKIALARALYGRPRLIVLDEPNSNLDGTGEAALLAAIEAAKAWGSAIVLVTHSARLLAPMSKILVLTDGQVQHYGEREQVLEQLRPLRAVQKSRVAQLGSSR